jgi:hypothetical protein
MLIMNDDLSAWPTITARRERVRRLTRISIALAVIVLVAVLAWLMPS